MRKTKTAAQRAKALGADQAERVARIGQGIERDAEPGPQAKPTGKGPGRPKVGRRSNPDYQSVTTFLNKKTYHDTQRALFDTGQDFGELIDELLAEWLKGRS